MDNSRFEKCIYHAVQHNLVWIVPRSTETYMKASGIGKALRLKYRPRTVLPDTELKGAHEKRMI